MFARSRYSRIFELYNRDIITEFPSDCWKINPDSGNKKTLFWKRSLYGHTHDHEFYKFYRHVGDQCSLSHRKCALSIRYYERVNTDYTSEFIYVLFPLQHRFGEIDILKNKMTDSETKILSRFDLEKKVPIDNKLDGSPVPSNYSDWPDVFTLLGKDEDLASKVQKICDVRKCLKGMIYFVRKCVYDYKEIWDAYLRYHLDFILSLQILLAQLEA